MSYLKNKNLKFDINTISQTTIIAIAIFSYTLYDDYKIKQNSCENLMRYVIYSDTNISTISKNVRVKLKNIDDGFNFEEIGVDKS